MKKGLDAEGETKKASHPIDRGAPAVRRIEDASVSTCRITYLGIILCLSTGFATVSRVAER